MFALISYVPFFSPAINPPHPRNMLLGQHVGNSRHHVDNVVEGLARRDPLPELGRRLSRYVRADIQGSLDRVYSHGETAKGHEDDEEEEDRGELGRDGSHG